MRVSDNTNFETVRNSIRRSKERMENLQTQTATLKKLNTPSDDPVGAAKVLEMRTDKVTNDQFQMNAKMASAFLNNSDHALGDLVEVINRAKEIALGQSSGASSNDDTRVAIAEEVSQLYNHAVATANRRVGDRFLFGGYKTQKPPVDADGRYQGDDGQMMVEVAKDVFLSINVPGSEAFNSNPKNSSDGRGVYERELNSRAPASLRESNGHPGAAGATDDARVNVNVFDELQNLRIALLTGDMEGIRDTLERFDTLHSRLNATRAKIGSRMSGLEQTETALERHNLTNAQLTSSLEDADMAQVVSDLAKEETVFKSALASSQKLIQPTLMEFLK
jgi:flagellar hook-associated protein 3 FlgL